MAKETLFSLLARSGPFAIGDTPPGLAPFSAEARFFARELASLGLSTRYRILTASALSSACSCAIAHIADLFVGTAADDWHAHLQHCWPVPFRGYPPFVGFDVDSYRNILISPMFVEIVMIYDLK